MTAIKNKLDFILSKAIIIIMALMVINVLWQVFTRFILQDPSSYTEELARYSLVWLGILGASYVAGQRMHLAIDLLSTKLKGKKKIYLGIFIEVSIFFFAFVVMLVGGLRLSILTLKLEQISAALQIPLGYVYFVIPLSGLFMCFYAVYFVLDYISQLKKL